MKTYTFTYLDVSKIVPTGYVISNKDHNDNTLEVNQLVVLQACLNNSSPFNTGDRNSIYILKSDGEGKTEPCSDRGELMVKCANRLLAFERLCTRMEDIFQHGNNRLEQAVEDVDWAVQLLQYKTRQWEDIKARILEMRIDFMDIMPTGRKLRGRGIFSQKVVGELYDGFKTHGPPMQQIQIYRAVASILQQVLSDRGAQIVGIDKAKSIDKIAEMLKKRTNRGKKFQDE